VEIKFHTFLISTTDEVRGRIMLWLLYSCEINNRYSLDRGLVASKIGLAPASAKNQVPDIQTGGTEFTESASVKEMDMKMIFSDPTSKCREVMKLTIESVQ